MIVILTLAQYDAITATVEAAWRRHVRWCALFGLALVLTGCSLAPSDKVMEQFAANERSWCLSITSVYGTLRMGGTGIQGGTMVCTQEGMNVKDDAARMTVPITVAPQIMVAPSAPVTKP